MNEDTQNDHHEAITFIQGLHINYRLDTMGKRVEGKIKNKSKKARVTSKFSGKRKLSRMGKKIRKGQMGPNTDFLTRSSVLKRLQISLKDFRRLCILKGIYPRVPGKAPKGADKIYYDIKDISYLAHEPLLAKFRQFKTFMKKIRKAAGRNQVDEARRKDRLKPVMALDHLVKERYPRFIDALRDLDDALCMIHLFAALPSAGRITAERTVVCSELARHWQYYVAKSKSLKKVFVSVKGVYFQAEVMGEAITWLVPHQFTQTIPKEVDLRVMMTFLEFYEVFLKFTLFKLYNLLNLSYPPTVDPTLNDAGCCLLALRTTSAEGSAITATVSEKVTPTSSGASSAAALVSGKSSASAKDVAALNQKLAEMATNPIFGDEGGDDDDEDEDNEPIAGPLAEAFATIAGDDDDYAAGAEERVVFASGSNEETDAQTGSKIFQGLKFFVNREVPLDWLQLCIISFGGKIGWEGALSPYPASDSGITHHIVDRPMQGNTLLSREYVQPQWVFDSVNAEFLLPVSKYRPGSALPPHLSPFVDDDKEGYRPRYKEEVLALKDASSIGSEKTSSAKEILEESEEESDEDENEYAAQVKAEKLGKSSVVTNKKEKKTGGKSQSKPAKDDAEDEEAGDGRGEFLASRQDKKGPKGVVFEPKQQAQTEVSWCWYTIGCISYILFTYIYHQTRSKKGVALSIACTPKGV